MDRRQVDLREVRPIVERLHIERPDDTVIVIADKKAHDRRARAGDGRGEARRHQGSRDRRRERRGQVSRGQAALPDRRAPRRPASSRCSSACCTSMSSVRAEVDRRAGALEGRVRAAAHARWRSRRRSARSRRCEKPEQAPVTPTMQIAKESGVNLELDVEAISAGLGAEFGSAGGGGGDGTRRGALAFNAGLVRPRSAAARARRAAVPAAGRAPRARGLGARALHHHDGRLHQGRGRREVEPRRLRARRAPGRRQVEVPAAD